MSLRACPSTATHPSARAPASLQEKKPADLFDALAPADSDGGRLEQLAEERLGRLKDAVSEKWTKWFGNTADGAPAADEYTAEQVLQDLRAEREAKTPAPPPPRTYGPMA
jgi:hypothetical protein